MKSFLKVYLSNKRIFWATTIGTDLILIILMAYFSDSQASEIIFQMGVSVVTLPVLVWVFGGYNGIKNKAAKHYSIEFD